MIAEVTSAVLEGIRAEAAAADPRECCGILLGDGGTVRALAPARNVHPAPETHFEIDPRALIDAYRAARGGGPQVMGYYHSHPHGPAEPSATDRASAARDGRIWAIAGEGEVRFWRDDEAGFEPLSLRVIDR
ncbi:Mov34/MPN/PAD-1 family protein [Pelagerythrobacter aerophilus]|uniref:M67 family peptidase n=1 Tax=Pelagerythrobacter aerophilus TaxID=2306995 RepID=A0A418NH72_9SPHN|nr:M67 family metallopeptidase [Pelagerythrobacter aerophilus]RIV77974.1 M67 family peptidase [Pelagerythrobacter aerophilus]